MVIEIKEMNEAELRRSDVISLWFKSESKVPCSNLFKPLLMSPKNRKASFVQASLFKPKPQGMLLPNDL